MFQVSRVRDCRGINSNGASIPHRLVPRLKEEKRKILRARVVGDYSKP